MWSYIFLNYYLVGLYFGTIDSMQKYPPIKIHFDEIMFEGILSACTQHFYKIHPNSIRITSMLLFKE